MGSNVEGLLVSVGALRDRLRESAILLDTAGAAEARRTRDEILGHIDDYLIPRLESMDAPLLAVVGGSTGAGKSTLVNSLVGRSVSAASVLRPTTTTPIVVAHPTDLHWFEGPRILPDLPRLTGSTRQGDHGLVLMADDDVPPGLALLDAPDVDSVVEANRTLAAQLLAAADLWLFATTAARYADSVPWDLLKEAHRRSAAVALVLNRVPKEALEEVPTHLAQMLVDEGLVDAPVLTIPEAKLDDGLIPAAQLAPLRGWLEDLASDADKRGEVIRGTLRGALDALPERASAIVEHLEQQTVASRALVSQAADAYAAANRDIENGLSSGTLLRGEVLARWHEFIGTGDFMRSIQSSIGRARDRVGNIIFGRPPVENEVRSAVESHIEAVVVAACNKAVERTVDAWRATPEGRKLISDELVPTAASRGLRGRVDAAVRAWQGRVLQLVSEQGQDKRAVGRAMSLGVNATGAAVMIAVFAHTGGLTGGEVAVAGGTAALSQRLLEALFGDQAVRSLTNEARSDLLRRLDELVQAEAERFERPAHEAAPDPRLLDELRAATVELARAEL